MVARRWAVAALLLVGCAGTPDRYGFDSATSACRQSPALCARIAGEETLVPMARPAAAAASAALTGGEVWRVLKAEDKGLIEQALAECADEARSAVLVEKFNGRSPTPEECRAEVERDAQGNSVTLAMKLGTEMHQVALQCAHARLSRLRPGGFSLEPRYRYNPETKRWEFVSEPEVRSLLRQGRGSEFRGTILPDVVIHTGDPIQVLAIYDFKFPCVNPEAVPRWPRYPRGHAHEGQRQDAVYKDVLRPKHGPSQILPRLGVMP